MGPTDTPPPRKLSAPFWRGLAERHLEALFITAVLVSIGAITFFADDKLALLNFFFIPILLAGYFLSARSAVLGGVLSIVWVVFFVLMRPESFYWRPSRLGLYLHLATWGGFLVLCGALVVLLNENVRERFNSLRSALAEWKKTQLALDLSQESVEDKNRALDALRTRLESLLYATMDPVAAHLAANRRLVDERREISVLVADLVGFDDSSDAMSPKMAIGQLNALFTQLEPVLEAYHGHIDKLVGDSVTVEFGIPLSSRHDALLAVLSGLKMQETARRKGFPWTMRVGVSRGRALVGMVGSAHHASYGALGPVVSLAAGLGDICPPGRICVDGAVHERIRGAFKTRRLFAGRTSEPPEVLEDLLASVEAHLRAEAAPSLDILLEAGRLHAELGDVEQAVAFYKRALKSDPDSRPMVEKLIAEARFHHEANLGVALKRKAANAEAFEVLALKDPLGDPARIPRRIAAMAQEWFKAENLDREMLLPMEASKGCVGHSQTTAALSAALAETLGLSEEERRAAFLAGFFHDIGMRSLPPPMADWDELKPNPTAEDEMLIHSHPEAAPRVLEDLGVALPREAVEAILQHHENCDGGGYPRRLKAAAITLVARIVRVADEYDGATAWRPFYSAWSPVEALARLKLEADMAGKLDSKIVSVFARMIVSGGS